MNALKSEIKSSWMILRDGALAKNNTYSSAESARDAAINLAMSHPTCYFWIVKTICRVSVKSEIVEAID